jgi:hypothetical protein
MQLERADQTGFNSRNTHVAIALCAMAVANRKVGTFDEDRKTGPRPTPSNAGIANVQT